MPSPYRKEIYAQVLNGKRHWSNSETDGDDDAFFTEVITPLRELKYERIIDTLSEIEFAIDGNVHIVGEEIIDAINYHHEDEKE
jgi:hypothetical protein